MLAVALALAHAGTELATPVADAGRSWLLTETLAMEMRVPVKGWTRAETVAVWLVDWAPGEDSLGARLCRIDVAPVYGVTMAFDPGLVANLPPQRRPVASDGEAFEVPRFGYAFGLGDDDADGAPGVSATLALPVLGRVQMSIVQEASLALSGTRHGDGAIRGTTRWSQTQRILASSRSWLSKPLESRDAAEPGSFTLAPHPTGTCP